MHEQRNILKQVISTGKLLLTCNVFVHLPTLKLLPQPFHMSGRRIRAIFSSAPDIRDYTTLEGSWRDEDTIERRK